MQRHAKSEPHPQYPIPSKVSEFHSKPDETNFDTDFANLAARFGAQSGGTLSLELCADLALEIVLNEIVEQACRSTGASGAAIVLQRDGEMVCRASSGATAPELGARLDSAAGISGHCVKTRQTQRCDDVLTDPRVDLEASERLGVRSVVVMPLLRGDEMVGVIELFSFRSHAFGESDEQVLETLAERTVRNLDRAAEQIKQLATEQSKNPQAENKRLQDKHSNDKKPEVLNEVSLVSETIANDFVTVSENSSPRRFDLVTWTFAAVVVACAIWLGVLLGKPLALQKVIMRTYPKPVSAAPALAAPNPAPGPGPSQPEASIESPGLQPVSKPIAAPQAQPGSLQVFEDDKEVFRMPPAQTQVSTKMIAQSPSKPQKAAELSSMDGILLHRVEPEYPEQAREQKVEGVVVLEVQVGADGAVQHVGVLSGPPLLIEASTDAVKQWRFKPYFSNGRPVEMQRRVSLNFKLPD